MALISDTFTDTAGTLISAHTPNTGGPWVKNTNASYPGNRTLAISAAGRAYGTFTGSSGLYIVGPQPTGFEYQVQADIVIVTKLSDFPGITGRTSWITANTMYLARLNIGGNAVELLKLVAGAGTTLGTSAKTFNAGETHTLMLEIKDATKKVFLNGVEVISSTDNTIPWYGYGGIRLTTVTGHSSSAGTHLDNFTLTDLPSVIADPPLSGRTTIALPTTLHNTYDLNGTAFIQDHLWTDSGIQHAVWVDSSLKPRAAKRTLPDGAWGTAADLSTVAGNPLASPTEQDPHNTYQIAVSTDGRVHVCGNHHDDALRYVRTTTPGDLATFASAAMVGTQESSVTYPTFVKLNDATLLFFYRDGIAGQGDLYINRYNASNQTWARVGKIIDGQISAESPYWNHVAVAPDGTIHVFYLWRATGGPDTNNDVCHIKSTDGGTTWRNQAGSALTLPITHATSPLILDTAATGSGLLNQNGADVDTLGRPHAAFFLFDGAGKTQINHVWHDGSTWHVDQVTSFTFRHDLTPGVVDAFLARPMVLCGADGRTFILYRSNPDNRGHLQLIDVTPDVTPVASVSLWNTDTYYHEPTPDTRALKDRDELHIVATAAAPYDTGNPDFQRLTWSSQAGVVLSIAMGSIGVRSLAGTIAAASSVSASLTNREPLFGSLEAITTG